MINSIVRTAFQKPGFFVKPHPRNFEIVTFVARQREHFRSFQRFHWLLRSLFFSDFIGYFVPGFLGRTEVQDKLQWFAWRRGGYTIK
jgi:hypothetical protein|mmetsp:Transcript_29551/g.47597  ORF Transcript_29551/g.47597 Transcript_29551/m.47597 type:complete len:87 (-) Transcript_29551:180-440(-)